MSIVYTIGYEGTDINRFVRTLHHVGVDTIADVRAVPISRKKGFSKTALRSRLEAEGLSYLHFASLGDPKPGREAARAGQLAKFRRIYVTHLAGAEADDALNSLLARAHLKPVCLMCFERDPAHCHRTIIADRLASTGMKIIELYGDDPDRYARNTLKLSRRHAGQGDAKPQPQIR